MNRYRLRFLLQEIDLRGPIVTIGRSPECQISLDDPMVSRRHAELSLQQGATVVRDLGSRNGVRLNDQPISGEAALQNGDRIRIGSQELHFSISSESTRPKRRTGRVRLCPECDVPYSAEEARCTHCGAIPTQDDAHTGVIAAVGSAWTLHLLSKVIEPALRAGRYAHAEKMLSRGAADLEARLNAEQAVDFERLEGLLTCAVRLSVAVNRSHWIEWVVSIYEQTKMPPSEQILGITRDSQLPDDPAFRHAAHRLHRIARHVGDGPSPVSSHSA